MLRNTLCFLAAVAILVTGAACDRVAAPAATASSGIEALRAFAGAVERGQDTAFTARYAGTDGLPVTVAQEPPRRSYQSATSTYLLQPDGAYLCRTAIEPASCEQ